MLLFMMRRVSNIVSAGLTVAAVGKSATPPWPLQLRKFSDIMFCFSDNNARFVAYRPKKISSASGTLQSSSHTCMRRVVVFVGGEVWV